MASEPSPAFLFYVKDWRSSRKVQGMNFATRGMYLEIREVFDLLVCHEAVLFLTSCVLGCCICMATAGLT
jgi:hypothetical protein